MAQQTLIRRHLLSTSLLALGIVALLAAFRDPLASVEDGITGLKYRLRGEEAADTNIILVYIDNDAITDLGWPVRRSFSALMVSVLTDLRVRAIGMEILFDRANVEYPEYDDLLASVLRASGSTVLPCYLDSVGFTGTSPAQPLDTMPAFRYPGVADPGVAGTGLHVPLPRFTAASAGLGHVNFLDDQRVPLWVGYGQGVIPSFGAEILRVAMQTDRHGVFFDGNSFSLGKRGHRVTLNPAGGSAVTLRHPGTIAQSFRAYPFLEVLRSYDALRADLPGAVPVQTFRDKIILVGVLTEGRTMVYPTPFDPRTPALALHATFMDNALRSGFMSETPSWLVSLLSLVLGILVSGATVFLRRPWNRVVAVAVPILAAVISFVLFVAANHILPLLPPFLTMLACAVGTVVFRYRAAREESASVTQEKETILARLHDREARLAVLERELLDAGSARSADRTQELMDEIRRYKAEIRALSSRADDMEEYRKESDEEGIAEFEGIVFARNGRMRQAVEFVTKIAESEAPVLILGESGTGKELIARAIHARSPRAKGPFIAVNCGALSENLLESELFGHEKGAFTGAVKERIGRFELAEGGTIFLDEIGEVSDAFQLKLLRVLQEGELERVGGTRTIRLNVRIVAATNKDLKEMVKEKRFREDLYYRLNVLSVALPPLRERQDDIPVLLNYFLAREGSGMRVSRNVMEGLLAYSWPGNVRELESVIRRGILLARAEKRSLITVQDLTDELASVAKDRVPVHELVLDSLREKGFSRSSVSETAAELGGLNRGTVAEYLRGECLKAFGEQHFDLERAVRHITLSTTPEINDRVRKRLLEYLENITAAMDRSQPWDVVRLSLRSKTKNLPQRYHQYLEQVAEAYFRGLWQLPPAGA